MKWLLLPLYVEGSKPWDGSTIHTDSLGGSESAVAYLAKSLSKVGENVSVVAPAIVGQAATFDDVKYYGHHHLGQLITEEWDVVVSSRWPEVLGDPNWRCRLKVFWTHDMPYGRLNLYAHRVACLTEYHREAWGFNEEQTFILGNGVDMSLFNNVGELERDENKLIWTSNPDRGLAIAARIFQSVRERWPDLELHVYGRASVYGWPDHMESPYLPLEEHRENVFLHDPLPRYALAKELKTSWAMFYPTYWPETYCIAALEAQAAGTPVVSVPWGALEETVKGGILQYDILNSISQLRNKRRWNKLSEAGKEWAEDNTWIKQARKWVGEVRGALPQST